MVTAIYLSGALWLGVIAIGLWKVGLGLKVLLTRQTVLRNFRYRVTLYGPARLEDPPTRVTGDLARMVGIVQVIGGLLIAGPLGLVPALGGGFPNIIFLSSAVSWIIAWLGTWTVKRRARRLD
jgi:hypothetical protein